MEGKWEEHKPWKAKLRLFQESTQFKKKNNMMTTRSFEFSRPNADCLPHSKGQGGAGKGTLQSGDTRHHTNDINSHQGPVGS